MIKSEENEDKTTCYSTMLLDEKYVSESLHDVISYTEDFIVLDVETTGRDIKSNRIIQLAMIKVTTNGNVDTWCKFFNPCMSRESQLNAFKIHKISPDLLLQKKTFRYHFNEILEFIGDVKYFVGHNVLFDWNYLRKEISFASSGQKSVKKDALEDIVLVDTYKSSISAFPCLPRYNLESLAKFLDLETHRQPVTNYVLSSPKKNKKEIIKVVEPVQTSFHDALTDIMVTKEVLGASLEQLNFAKVDSAFSLENIQHRWPQFTYPVRSLSLIDKLLNGFISDMEKTNLLEFARTFMSSIPCSRGKLLKDMSKKDLMMSIQYYDLLQDIDINDQRCRALMDLVIDEESRINPESNCERKRKENYTGSKISGYFSQKKSRMSDESPNELESEMKMQKTESNINTQNDGNLNSVDGISFE